jgi:hypothetical protein
MADPQHTRAAILRSQPRSQVINCLTAAANGNFLVYQTLTGAILDRKTGISANAVDLATRFQAPSFTRWSLKNAEFQA